MERDHRIEIEQLLSAKGFAPSDIRKLGLPAEHVRIVSALIGFGEPPVPISELTRHPSCRGFSRNRVFAILDRVATRLRQPT